MTGRGSGAKQKTRRGFYQKAGVVFPVRRIQRHLRGHHLVNHKARVSTTGALYLAAVLEYITAEVLELSGMAAHDNKKKRISPKSIFLAIKSDDEFRQLTKGSIMPHSGNYWGGALLSAGSNSSSGPTAIQPVPGKTVSGQSKGHLNLRKSKAIKGTVSSRKGRKTHQQAPRNQVQAGAQATWTSISHRTALPPAMDDEPLPGTVETLSQRTLVSGVQLSVLKADITSVEADCYVNPTSSSVAFAGQVGNRMLAVGGALLHGTIAGELYQHMVIPPCGAVTSPAAGLLAQHIIHCNSPSWTETDSIQKLQQTVTNCLDEVTRLKLTSVAMPSIGSGGNRFPKHTAAQTILRGISTYYKNKPPTDFHVKRIIFVLYDKQSVNVFRTELARLIE